MLKRENVKNIAIENGKVTVYYNNGTKKEVRKKQDKMFLMNRMNTDNFDTLTYVIEDYNEYKKECNRVKRLVKNRYLPDFGIEFKRLTGRQGLFQYEDCCKVTKTRKDGTTVAGYEYILDRNVKIENLEKLYNSFDNVIALQYKNGKYGIFVGTKKMRNF